MVQDFKEFVKRRPSYVICMVIILVAAFGYEITNFTLSNDEELYINTSRDVLFWLQDGRFGFTLFNSLFLKFGMFGPFQATFISTILLFIASTGMCINYEMLNKGRNVSDFSLIIFSSIFCTVPFVVAEFMIYNTVNIQFSLAIILISISMYQIIKLKDNKSDYLRWVFAILSTYFAFSFYQGFISLFITSASFYILCELIHSKENIKIKRYLSISIPYIIVMFISFILYEITNKIISLFVVQRSYLQQMLTDEGILKATKSIVIRFLTCNDDYGMNLLRFTVISGSILLIILMIQNYKNIVWYIITYATFVISPFIIFVVLGTSLIQFRSLTGICMLFGGVWLLITEFVVCNKFNLKIKKITINPIKVICVIPIIMMLYQVQIINNMFYSDNVRYEEDTRIIENILGEIEKIDSDYLNKTIVFSGYYKLPDSPAISRVQVIGMSIFEWEGGNNARIIPFINSKGFKFPLPTEEDLVTANEVAQNMPSWPSSGSIVEHDNLIIVNLKH